ncbi:MAG: endonuclease/exonuclease/phosphatase family protein [Candidatus Doudnabacteria bacterium]|nr:endonuclease/exonuclease/phosphatase family protein [Candidatus Doudnabacteria bacterium]
MKLVSLNILMGEVHEPFMEFVKSSRETTDIFCFQEVFDAPKASILKELKAALSEFDAYFAPSMRWKGRDCGLGMFVRKEISIKSQGDFFVFGKFVKIISNDFSQQGKKLQYIRFTKDGQQFTIANFHGWWFDGPKVDNPGTLEQMKLVKEFLDKQLGEKIICGDFNLNPDTQSMELLEDNMINLIKKFRIASTRPDSFPKHFSRFADYILVSRGVKIKNFEVPNLEISDHLPMILEFD